MSTATTVRSFKVGCKTRNDTQWTYNALRFPTREAAEAYGSDLYSRWTALDKYEVHESEEEPATVGIDKEDPNRT